MGFDLGQWLFGGASQQAPTGNPYLQQTNNQLMNGVGAYGGIGAAAPTIAGSGGTPYQNAQLGLMNTLQGQASGQQQTAGELAAQRQGQQANQQQMALARMQGGAGSGLAALNAARQIGNNTLNTANVSQQAALQGQQQAQGLLGQTAAQGANQAYQNAQLNQQQQQMAMQGILGMGGLGQQQYGTQAGIYGAQQSNPGILGGLIGAGGQVGAAAALHSDERLKTDIQGADDDIDDMLGKLLPKAYVYRDRKHGIGPRVGIMAQALERSKAGRTMVREAPDGKAIDIPAAISALLASAARLHHRVAKVESR